MIPKIIHFCWYGKQPLPTLAKECIKSWKKHCSDYIIKEWNETNTPFELYPFAQAAYQAKKWAFVSDVIRLHALATEGGIYMDTDVELIKPLDQLLMDKAFTGYEKDTNGLQTAILGAEPDHPWILELLNIYKSLDFKQDRSSLCKLINNNILTDNLKQKGFNLNGKLIETPSLIIYPQEYFCPMDLKTRYIVKTTNTICIHYYTFSWSEPETFKGWIKVYTVRLIGEKRFRFIINTIRKLFHLR